MSSTVYTTFYDRPGIPGMKPSITRVTSQPFILATNSTMTYIPPQSWPTPPPSSTDTQQSPIFLDAPAARANTITTDRLDLTALTQPAHNPVASVVSMQYLTINENATNTIRLNGKIYRENATFFMRPGSHGVRINANATQQRDAEYVVVFTEERDWTDRIALSVFLVANTADSASASQRYFAAVKTAQSTATGVPLSELYRDTGGAFTYHGTSLLQTAEPTTWYIFEKPASIAAADFDRIWKVADASGNLFAGPLTPTIAAVAGVFYLPTTSIVRAASGVGASAAPAEVTAKQCKIVHTNKYYDSKTGALRAVVEGDTLVPVSALAAAPTADGRWSESAAGSSAAADAAAADIVTKVAPPTDARPYEALVAVAIGLILAITLVIAVLKYGGFIASTAVAAATVATAAAAATAVAASTSVVPTNAVDAGEIFGSFASVLR
jgi:hypothetical protein